MSSATEDILFSPDPTTAARSQLSEFMRFCTAETGRTFADFTEFYDFSVGEWQTFWRLFLQWSDALREGPHDPVCTDEQSCEDAVFFPELRLSYVENVLRINGPRDAERLAVVAHHAARPPDRLTRGQLRDRVVAVAANFRQVGVGAGDRVVAVARNNAETVVAGLASAAVGATFSGVGPEMGVATILDRFEQLQPRLLVANVAVDEDPASTQVSDRVAEVAQRLPIASLVVLDDGPVPHPLAVPIHRLTEFFEQPAAAASDVFERFPFNHPLFVLFSSGTTGRPKCIVHGAGGTLLEHLKEHRLHVDLRATDTMFFQTSAAWMMWNWQLSALASGAAIVLYDGPIAGADTLWRLAELERVTVFGTSPPYLQLCEDSGYSPQQHRELPALRALLSTGSILHASQYDWVRDNVGPIAVQSISGGTDIIGCFVLGNPNLPVHRGLIQCRSLGLDVRALSTSDLASDSGVGELICRNPFPSRPVGFVGDEGRRRFHETYYSRHKGAWTHGDLIEINEDGQVRMHGRSDGILNIHGVRIGPAEIYRVLRNIAEISEAMAVEQQTPEGPEPARLVLLVVLRQKGTLNEALVSNIRRELANEASPAHVPQVVVEVDELPFTHSGKRSERAARDALGGKAVANAQALANPASLEQIVTSVARVDDAVRHRIGARSQVPDPSTAERLRTIWEEVLGVAPLALDDNFFEVGGTSLAGVRLLNAVRLQLGIELPLSTLLHARTITAMTDVIDSEGQGFPLPVLIKPGTGERPLFIVHGLFGDILQFRTLGLALKTDRPVYGLQSLGLDRRAQPHTTVEEMAAAYVGEVRRIQPVGPYAFAGHSFGGLVAFEMARIMALSGEHVDSLTLIDTAVHPRCLSPMARVAFRTSWPLRRAAAALRTPRHTTSRLLHRTGHRLAPSMVRQAESLAEPLPPSLTRIGDINMVAFRRYRPASYPGTAMFVRAANRNPAQCNPLPVWTQVVEPGLAVESLECRHDEILSSPHVQLLADRMSARLR